MRALRVALAGTVILALLGGLGGAVAGQTEDEPASASITAGAPASEIIDPGSIEFGEGVIQYRDVIQKGTIEDPSDPRFSGTWTWTSSRDQHSGTTSFDITSGFFRVENELGAWQGLPTVWLDDGGGFGTRPATVVFAGEGAYEGWVIVAEKRPSLASREAGQRAALLDERLCPDVDACRRAASRGVSTQGTNTRPNPLFMAVLPGVRGLLESRLGMTPSGR